MKLTVVILARTDSAQMFEMTSNCVRSLLDSEPQTAMEVIIVESNKQYNVSGFDYPQQVKVIVPQEPFNFHRFLNIGIEAASGDFIALCNNDLIFHPNWFRAILNISEQHPDMLSFSPRGIPCAESDKEKFTIGYRVMQQLMGWCFVVKREIFQTIGKLDETFDFYYADNDYGMTLRYFNIKHALVFGSYVEHLERKSEPKIIQATVAEKAFVKKYSIPKYLKNPKYDWVFESERYLSGILNYHNKWGSPDLLYRKNKIADFLTKYQLGSLNRFFIKIKF